ncbi:hypothetical protein CR513_42735, partial [Mucuna pruriens]
MNNDVKPNISFLGRSLPKSCSWYRDVSMDRNNASEVMEQHRAISDDMPKTLNSGLSSRVGMPVLFWTPPGTVLDVAKATVAITAATTEHDSEVLFSHSPPLLTRPSCVSLKISLGVLYSLLYRRKKLGAMDSLTNCISSKVEV